MCKSKTLCQPEDSRSFKVPTLQEMGVHAKTSRRRRVKNPRRGGIGPPTWSDADPNQLVGRGPRHIRTGTGFGASVMGNAPEPSGGGLGHSWRPICGRSSSRPLLDLDMAPASRLRDSPTKRNRPRTRGKLHLSYRPPVRKVAGNSLGIPYVEGHP